MNGDIYIDGPIDEAQEQYVRQQLRANKDKDRLTVHIASGGGDVYAGYNIYQALLATAKPIDVIIEGEAQSIATVIALAGNTITALNPSVVMIHLPYSGILGTADDHEAGARALRNVESDIAEAYSKKMSITKDQALQLMKAETSMTAHQAKDLKLIDEVKEPLRMVALGKPINSPKMTKKEQIIAKLNELDMSFTELFAKKKKDKEPVKVEPVVDTTVKTLEDRLAEIEAAMVSLKQENETLKTEKLAAETLVTEAVAEKDNVIMMAGKIKDDFENFKKMTVGDDSAPGKGAVNTPLAGADTNADQMAETRSFLSSIGLSLSENGLQKKS